MTSVKIKKKRGIGIKAKLIFFLALFTAFVLVVIWIFQLRLLGPFYERIKIAELHESASALSAVITDEEELKRTAEEVLSNSMIYSKVYKVKNETAFLIMSQNYAGNYFLKTAKGEELTELFNCAVESNGVYYERRASHPGAKYDRIHKELIYVQIYETNEELYIIMLDMMYTPLNSMVDTLNLQFTWIAAILLLGAVMFGAVISYQISTPLTKMTESAKKLAQGKYDTDFAGGGFREAKDLADTLNYASEELSRSDKMQKELLANISHDLRTPLTMISGYGEVMRDVPGENTPENIQIIIDESTRLSELVNDLLDLSKIQTESVKFEKTRVDLTDAIESTLVRYNKLMERDGFTIEFFSDGNAFVEADKIRMLQVIYNLTNNALNYSGEDKYVCVKQEVNDGKVRISITDHGDGIAPEDIAMIWDRYYKVDRVHKRAVVGTGLGLSIVKGILEAHGATYGVESALGYGSTFWFELPILDFARKSETKAESENETE